MQAVIGGNKKKIKTCEKVFILECEVKGQQVCFSGWHEEGILNTKSHLPINTAYYSRGIYSKYFWIFTFKHSRIISIIPVWQAGLFVYF